MIYLRAHLFLYQVQEDAPRNDYEVTQEGERYLPFIYTDDRIAHGQVGLHTATGSVVIMDELNRAHRNGALKCLAVPPENIPPEIKEYIRMGVLRHGSDVDVQLQADDTLAWNMPWVVDGRELNKVIIGNLVVDDRLLRHFPRNGGQMIAGLIPIPDVDLPDPRRGAQVGGPIIVPAPDQYEYEYMDDCVRDGKHKTHIDMDGYCGFCGSDEDIDDDDDDHRHYDDEDDDENRF